MPGVYQISLRQRDTVLNVVADSMPNIIERRYVITNGSAVNIRVLEFPTLYDCYGNPSTAPSTCYDGSSNGMGTSSILFLPESSIAAVQFQGGISLSATPPTDHFFSVYVRGRTTPLPVLGGPWTWAKTFVGTPRQEPVNYLKDVSPLQPLPETSLDGYGNPTGLLPFPLPGGHGYSDGDWTSTGGSMRIRMGDVLAIVPRFWAP
jgi:hypothetical protein